MLRRYAELILLIKWPLCLGILLGSLLAGQGALKLRIDPTVETLFSKKSPEYEYYRQYRDRYGSDQMVAVAMSTTDLFTASNLGILKKVTENLSAYSQVESILSLTTVMNIRHKMFGVKVVPALEGGLSGARPLSDIKKEILSNELYVNNLVSPDGKSANMIVRLKPSLGREAGDFIHDLRLLLTSYEKPGVKFYVAGSPVEQFDFVRLIRRDQFTFIPMITVLLLATTWLIYRSMACMIVAMSVVFITLVMTFGIIGAAGRELNLVTSLLAPVIMIISVADVIHFMSLFFEIRPHHSSVRRAIVITVEHLGVPCFLTHVTTILGFISLSFSRVPAIQEFGIFSALGVFFSYLVTMLLTPILLPILPYRIPRETPPEAHFFNRVMMGFIERLEVQWKWLIFAGVAVSIVFSVTGIRRLDVDTNIVKQMKPNSPLAVATRFIDQNITGVYTLGFVLRPRDEKKVDDPRVLEQIDAFKSFLESMPEIAKVNSISTLIKRIHEVREESSEAYKIPEDPKTLEEYFAGIMKSDNSEISSLVSPDLREVNVQARMRAVGTKEGAAVEDAIRLYLEDVVAKDFEWRMTGNVVLLGRMSKDLVESQTRSFCFAFLTTLILIAIIFGSVRLGLLAAIPSLLPIAMVYGMMGYLKIELSSSTAMISSIVLGIVVDSSIHFLHRYRHEFQQREHYLQALHHTYRHVGQSLCVSTLILIAGFATSIFGGFRPTIYFGVLTSLAIFLALVCTLLVLPAFTVLVRPFGRPRGFRRKKSVSTGKKGRGSGTD